MLLILLFYVIQRHNVKWMFFLASMCCCGQIHKLQPLVLRTTNSTLSILVRNELCDKLWDKCAALEYLVLKVNREYHCGFIYFLFFCKSKMNLK